MIAHVRENLNFEDWPSARISCYMYMVGIYLTTFSPSSLIRRLKWAEPTGNHI